MQFILKIVRSKPFDALMGALFGFLVGAILFGIINYLHNLILVSLLGPPPAIVTNLLLPGLAGLLVLASGAFGFATGLGMFRGTRLGDFFYYASSTALFHGFVGMAIAFVLALSFFNLLTGHPPIELTEGGLVFAAVVSVIGFVLGAGVLTDWLLWIGGYETPLRHGTPEGKPEWFRYFTADVNHKVIGIQYGVTGLLVLLIGGLFAIMFRIELAQPGMQWLTKDEYNTLFSAHGIVMIASILLGVGAMINYLVPIMIGASDMAFPRLNAFSFWVAIPSVTLILGGMVIGGWDTGWVGYPTLSLTTPKVGVLLFLLGFWINGFSSIASAINMIVTTVTMR
ncbi:MAG: cbb3-type cytochrome c oxidase subunit I, partial [Candidatus Promineifilaceae bacterium]